MFMDFEKPLEVHLVTNRPIYFSNGLLMRCSACSRHYVTKQTHRLDSWNSWTLRYCFEIGNTVRISTRVLFNWVCKTILNQILFYLLSFWFWMAVWILALFWLLTSVNSQLRFVLKMISVTKGAKFQIANQNHNDSN